MSHELTLAPRVERLLRSREPFLWLNEQRLPIREAAAKSSLQLADVMEAERRWQRFAGLLATLFPELAASGGIIESQLFPAYRLRERMWTARAAGVSRGRWFIKGDHALPVAGSIKARGGIYEVLMHAEALAIERGLLGPAEDPRMLSSATLRTLFAQHEVAVGSTGNLGLSIGVIAAALGFQATVHMSSDAKEWKKERLRKRGVEVVEHAGDFGVAVAAGREQARRNPLTYFVDDENSPRLFVGYSAAAVRLKQQLSAANVPVDAEHPLFVYLPCGVGGAPGGITFGLRHLLGDHVHCFFAEPVASPAVLLGLAAGGDRPVSVRDVGLDNRTEADGLAVGQASEFVLPLMRSLVAGVFTVPDPDLFEDLYLLEQSEGLRIEPSAAAGFRGPRWVLDSAAGVGYLREQGLLDRMEAATHVLWTTGGAFVPEEEYWRFHERGRRVKR